MSSYEIVPPKESFRGRTYGEWAADWWKWLVFEDPDVYSKDEPVIFLRPNINCNSPKTNNQKIQIYEGTAIFFPMTAAESNEGDRNPNYTNKKIRNEAEMRKLVRTHTNLSRNMKATIKKGDGQPTPIVNDFDDYRAESPLFKLVVSRNSKLRKELDEPLNIGTFDAVADGYWLLLKSLPPDTYQIEFGGEGEGGCVYSATYELTVQPQPAQ